MLAWLLGAAVGPAAVALPVNWAADTLAGAAQRWFKRLRRTDDLGRLVMAATGTSVNLSDDEFHALRHLLEDQQMWSAVVGRGTVEDLASRIASCVPPRNGRTAEDSHAVALTIARGLLEFAVADLDPKLFQQVLLARLQRMETGQASALDKALHANSASVMEQLKQVLDRLPPGPADQGEIAVYLRTLIDWLGTDPWPRDLGESVPVPAAIERKLRVTAMGSAHEKDLDADALAQQCRRLVILGGPGSGKTWLAKRTARHCAEDALRMLGAGGTLGGVELPLYTTCSRLFSANGNIRDAAVSSALDQLPDMGGSRISAALHEFFAQRNAPVVLIIDSLDEAHGPRDRLRQADNLPWRVILTSRPSSWRNQLTIETGDSHRVGELQPLRYPDDVEPFIQRWFDGRPEGNDLAAQITGRPGLQQAATVPLILAFYCIIGGSSGLPEFRRDLHTKVLRRMLTGRWRDDDDHQSDPHTCIPVLRAWAWSGATSHPVSGVGTWRDDIPAERIRLGLADAEALDHVAAPLGLPDVDTGKVLRRFIHRSIREHLVAEHVAGLPVEDAAEVLLPHLWYDPDWEYSAAAAIVMHPQHDQLLRKLICGAAISDKIPADLSVIKVGWEFRRLLARVAAESSDADWSPEVAGIIGHARVELARSAHVNDLGAAVGWETSNNRAREALLGLLADQTDAALAEKLVGGIARLAPAAEDKRQAREALLGLLADQTNANVAVSMARGVVRLGSAAEDKRQAREALLGLLADQTSAALALALAGEIARLDPAAEDRRQVREALLGLLTARTDAFEALELVYTVVQLAPAAEDRRQARKELLRLLAGQSDANVAVKLAMTVVLIDPTAEDRRQVREALLGLLAGQTSAALALALAGEIARLDPTAEDRRQVREALLGLLAAQSDANVAANLAHEVVGLDPTAEDRRQVREALLGLLAAQSDANAAANLAHEVVGLDPTAEDRRQVREALLGLLAAQTGPALAEKLVGEVARLAPTAEDRRQVREALLGLLAAQTGPALAEKLVGEVDRLAPTAEDRRQVREALLRSLAIETDGELAALLANGLAELDPTAEEKRHTLKALLMLLAAQTDGWTASR